MQLTIGDAPGDSIAAFAMPINSVSLTSSTGAQVQLLAAPVTVEVTQLVGTTTPLIALTIPTGTYTQASISLGAPQVTVFDTVTRLAAQRTLAAPLTNVTLTLNPSFQLTTSPRVLNLELSLSKSVTGNTPDNLSFVPVFVSSQAPLATGSAVATPFNGGFDFTIGTVSGPPGANSFTLKPVISGPTVTFTVAGGIGGGTTFVNLAGLNQLLAGMLVSVEGQTQTDGSILATRVTALNTSVTSTSVIGQAATVTGTPATQFQVVELGIGGVAPPQATFGSAVTVDLSAVQGFGFDGTNFDLNPGALGFTPSFTAATLKVGQVVEMDTTTPLLGVVDTMLGLPVAFSITPSQVQLQPQALTGAVSNFTAGGNTFTLTLLNDSVFALVTTPPTTTVTVHMQSKTSLEKLTAITNGSTVVVRGLLFFDNGVYKLVASRITTAP